MKNDVTPDDPCELSDVTIELHFGEEKMYVSDEGIQNAATDVLLPKKVSSVFLFGTSNELEIYKANLAESEKAFRADQENDKLNFQDDSSVESYALVDADSEEVKEKANNSKPFEAQTHSSKAKKNSVSEERIHVPSSREIFENGSSIIEGLMNNFWNRWQFLSHVNIHEDVDQAHTMTSLMKYRLADLRSAANVSIHYKYPTDVISEIQRVYGMLEHSSAKTLTLFETNVSPGIFMFTGLEEFNYISSMRDEGSNLALLGDRVEFEIFLLISRNQDLHKMHLPQSTPQQFARTIDQIKYRQAFELHVGHGDFVQFSLSYTDDELTAQLLSYGDNIFISRLLQKRKNIRKVNIHLLSEKALGISRPFFFDFELESVGVFRAEKMCDANIDPMKIVLAQINSWKGFIGRSKWEDFAFKWQHLTLETICDYDNADELDQLYIDMETIAKEVKCLKTITLKFAKKSETRLTEIASRVCRVENKWVGYKINIQQSSISCL